MTEVNGCPFGEGGVTILVVEGSFQLRSTNIDTIILQDAADSVHVHGFSSNLCWYRLVHG